ncbi:MAG TPA: DNA methyltransferase [Stellaceae bacterium]|nr:DNA methyltransferase [Stellaceae bacterium]
MVIIAPHCGWNLGTIRMTPEEFIARWRGTTRTERSAAQEHFLDLCELLGVPKPAQVDRHGVEYTFEKTTMKIGGKTGFADVWKKHCFAWEYKGKRRNLVEAYAQLKQYADAFENPPLLIVSDMQEIRVHTNFTNTVAQQHVIPLPDLVSVEARTLLHNCFLHPERLQPTETRESVTARAAARFANITVLLRQHHDERRVAHFINKLVFCLFAEDIELLPDRIFADILDETLKRPDDFVPMLRELFAAMANRNGRFGKAAIPWFNGGLFDDDDVLPLGMVAVRDLITAARLDWKAIDPTIFGTLFESGLDDKRRAEMASLFDAADAADRQQAPLFERSTTDKGVGIHYTDAATIMKVIDPVVTAPWRHEWEGIKAAIRDLEARRTRARSPAEKNKLLAQSRKLYGDFRVRLGRFRVLDPACGSGNFLALALRALKDFDLGVMKEASALELPPDKQRVGPEAVLGIEINRYAAELARLTVWITELQWQLRNNFELTRRPILGKLDGIVRADALVTPAGKEADWPEADVIIGNPPFLGDKLMMRKLGEEYTTKVRAAYAGRVPGGADLVCYWFEKARGLVASGNVRRAGLVATNSIRGGANRKVLDRIRQTGAIFDAWSDQPWVVAGAAVRVSLVSFSGKDYAGTATPRLDGNEVHEIYPDLAAGTVDLTRTLPLKENENRAFNGVSIKGEFEVRGSTAREWLCAPLNPNGRPNSDVVRPWINGLDVTRRTRDNWIVDFGERTEAEAALYEKPFAWIAQAVKPKRTKSRAKAEKRDWWLLARRAPAMRNAAGGLDRFIAVPETSQYRIFVYVPTTILPDKNLVVITRNDYTTFGVLQSRFHVQWSLRKGTSLVSRPRYTSRSTFSPFPFPDGMTPNLAAATFASNPHAVAIAAAARRLDDLRNAWLNPADLIRIEPEVAPGYPDRIVPRNADAARTLKKRTLTNLYNERPAWLANAQRDLDAAVAAAYGWPADISDDDALARLLALNHARSEKSPRAPSKRAAKSST